MVQSGNLEDGNQIIQEFSRHDLRQKQITAVLYANIC